MIEEISLKVATPADVDGILQLHYENQAAQGGTLSGGALTQNHLEEMMSDMPQIVAYFNKKLVGFILTTSQAMHKKRSVPIVDAMSASYRGSSNSYFYGPVCVSNSLRGHGLAQQLFQELLRQIPHREGILFIRSDNEASLHAHEKMGMKRVSKFNYNGAVFYVYSYLFQ